MNVAAIIQARRGSERLPNKVVAPIGPYTVLEQVIRRVQLSRRLQGMIVATTTEARDDLVAEIATKLGVAVSRGSERDVLDRYHDAAHAHGVDVIVRITADCPLIDPMTIDDLIALFERAPTDYANIDGYPNGIGEAEMFSRALLDRCWHETRVDETYFREHVSTYAKAHPELFSLTIETAPAALRRPELRVSVDEQADLDVARLVSAAFAPRLDFTAAEMIAYLDAHPEVVAINRHVRQRS